MDATDFVPTWDMLARIAPAAAIAATLIFVGWWMRHHETKHLREVVSKLLRHLGVKDD